MQLNPPNCNSTRIGEKPVQLVSASFMFVWVFVVILFFCLVFYFNFTSAGLSRVNLLLIISTSVVAALAAYFSQRLHQELKASLTQTNTDMLCCQTDFRLIYCFVHLWCVKLPFFAFARLYKLCCVISDVITCVLLLLLYFIHLLFLFIFCFFCSQTLFVVALNESSVFEFFEHVLCFRDI